MAISKKELEGIENNEQKLNEKELVEVAGGQITPNYADAVVHEVICGKTTRSSEDQLIERVNPNSMHPVVPAIREPR